MILLADSDICAIKESCLRVLLFSIRLVSHQTNVLIPLPYDTYYILQYQFEYLGYSMEVSRSSPGMDYDFRGDRTQKTRTVQRSSSKTTDVEMVKGGFISTKPEEFVETIQRICLVGIRCFFFPFVLLVMHCYHFFFSRLPGGQLVAKPNV